MLTDLFKKNKWCAEEDSLKLYKYLIYNNNIIMIFNDAPTDAPNYIFGIFYAINSHTLLGSGSVKVLA